MKKFLPVVIFVLAFTAAVAGQALFHVFSENASAANAKDETYLSYEKNFLGGKFKTIDGKSIEISKIKSPVVIYNFWASWCNPCMEEIPSMLAMKKKFTDDQIMVLAFNTDEADQLQNIARSVKKLNIKNEFQIIADKNTVVADSFKFSAIPVTIIFSHGKVVHFSNGPMDFNSEEMIGKLKKWTAN
jgi:thiol-disulfide isomerase/thioredoxin